MRAWKLAVLGLLVASTAFADVFVREEVLFGGSDTDTLEQVSPWIYVRGANRVEIQTWSAKAAFHLSTDADSTFSDSIAVFKVAFSDSIVSMTPRYVAADSVVLTTATVTTSDTSSKMVGVANPPLQEQLRGPANGSGIYTTVYATIPGSVGVYGDGGIRPKYMRVLVTPLRRSTVGGFLMTGGKRVVGLKGLRMKANVVWNFGRPQGLR